MTPSRGARGIGKVIKDMINLERPQGIPFDEIYSRELKYPLKG